MAVPVAVTPMRTVNVVPSIRAALVTQAREAKYPLWISTQQTRSFRNVVCWRDQLPVPGIVDLTEYLPFLALTS